MVRVYPNRNAVPQQVWDRLLGQATSRIDVLVYVGMFLTENPAFVPALRAKGGDGGRVVRRASRRGGEPLHLDLKDSELGRVGRYTEAGPGPAGTVLTVEFELNGQKFVALNGGPQFTFNEAISFQIRCDDQDEVDYYWSKLGEGGEEVACGRLKDKYGVYWQVTPTLLIDMIPHRPGMPVASAVTFALITFETSSRGSSK